MIFDDPTRHDQEQEQTVQQQPFSMADHLHRLGDLIDSNPLVTRLLATGLGSRLTDADAGRIAAIVESIEKAREQQVLTYGGEAAQSGNAGQYPQTSAQPSFTAVPRLLPEAPQEDVVQ